MLRLLARFLAVVFAVIFVACTVPIIFLHAAGTRLTQPQVYKDALKNERIYDRFPALAAGAVAHTMDGRVRTAANRGGEGAGSPVDFFRQLSPADWEVVFGTVLPPSYVRRQTERVLDQFFAWVPSEAPAPVVKIELGEFKRRLVDPETEEAYVRILQTKPPCTASELQSAGVLPVGCCPPPEEMPRVRGEFRTLVQVAAGLVPETVDVFQVLSSVRATAGATRKFAEVWTRLVQLEWLAWWSPAVPAALLLLIAVFAVRSLRGLMFWWGIPCLIAGAAGAILASSTVPAARWISVHVIVLHMPAEVPAAALGAFAGLVRAVVQPVMDAALHTAGILAIGGLVAVILGAVFKPRPKPAGAPRP